MRILVSSGGRFHALDLARQLQRLGCLAGLYTGYPGKKVDDEVDRVKLHTFPWLYAPYMACHRLGWHWAADVLTWPAFDVFDRWVARRLVEADVIVCLSAFGLHTFRAAKKRGTLTVCDRGSTHISYQNELLADEYARHGLKWRPNCKVIEKELAEYEEADLITIPSTFVKRSFVAQGISENKLAKISYGVDLTMFYPIPKTDDVFRVIYVGTLSLRKGIPYLLEALAPLRLPKFELTLIGPLNDEIKPILAQYEGSFRYLGPIPRSQLYRYYSQGSVFAIASIEEGLALVQAQAMACGLPVIATSNTGAEDLFSDNVEGFIVPIRNPEAIRERILILYHDPERHRAMAQAAQRRVRKIGGWDDYGDLAVQTYKGALESKRGPSDRGKC